MSWEKAYEAWTNDMYLHHGYYGQGSRGEPPEKEVFRFAYEAGQANSAGLHDVLRELRAERDRLIEKTTPEAERSTFFPQ